MTKIVNGTQYKEVLKKVTLLVSGTDQDSTAFSEDRIIKQINVLKNNFSIEEDKMVAKNHTFGVLVEWKDFETK